MTLPLLPLQIISKGGTLVDNMAATTRVTYVLIDPTDMSRVDELKRLRRGREKKFSIVTEEWVCARSAFIGSQYSVCTPYDTKIAVGALYLDFLVPSILSARYSAYQAPTVCPLSLLEAFVNSPSQKNVGRRYLSVFRKCRVRAYIMF